MKIIKSEKIPEPKGHYSPCIEHNGMLYLSGQVPVDPVSQKVPESIEEQTDLVLQKVEQIINESGSSKNHILQMRVYISDIKLWDIVNERYRLFFGNHKPVRTIIPTRDLHYGCLIEVEATAIIME